LMRISSILKQKFFVCVWLTRALSFFNLPVVFLVVARLKISLRKHFYAALWPGEIVPNIRNYHYVT
jgi:hypothetical protein